MSILDAMLYTLTYEREEKCHNIYRDNTEEYQDQEFNQCGNDS